MKTAYFFRCATNHIPGVLIKVGPKQNPKILNANFNIEISLRQRLLSASIVNVDYRYGIQHLAPTEVSGDENYSDFNSSHNFIFIKVQRQLEEWEGVDS